MEMSYAADWHREALIATSVVLFVFIFRILGKMQFMKQSFPTGGWLILAKLGNAVFPAVFSAGFYTHRSTGGLLRWNPFLHFQCRLLPKRLFSSGSSSSSKVR